MYSESREYHDREKKDGEIRNGVEHARRNLRGVGIDSASTLRWRDGCHVITLPEVVERMAR
jgi:hypothetical protein